MLLFQHAHVLPFNSHFDLYPGAYSAIVGCLNLGFHYDLFPASYKAS